MQKPYGRREDRTCVLKSVRRETTHFTTKFNTVSTFFQLSYALTYSAAFQAKKILKKKKFFLIFLN